MRHAVDYDVVPAPRRMPQGFESPCRGTQRHSPSSQPSEATFEKNPLRCLDISIIDQSCVAASASGCGDVTHLEDPKQFSINTVPFGIESVSPIETQIFGADPLKSAAGSETFGGILSS
jgi:hypothetical protein